ncbi:hypothetical protein [Pseudofulvimonas gallinarii]|jgi:hypothetical protein|uniref:Uncharacterized protein n=1 Tax=Pseudofulvimonas gallinarii TaxID=634155 RepID=A0A4R3L815_9GAMM|nr:hypothetical protein EDC25_12334 [Pseudofulvimonas gallinarii]
MNRRHGRGCIVLKFKATLTTLLILLSTQFATSASADDRQEKWDLAWRTLYEENRPLKAIGDLDSLMKTGWIHTNTFAQFYAFTGNLIETEFLAHAYLAEDIVDPPIELICEAYMRIPATEAIMDVARNAKLVMMNENHYSPLHRAFASQVIGVLRPIGFSLFGAETFSEVVAERSDRLTSPTLDLGVYSAEPMFGDLIRHAIAQGYVLFPYEQTAAQLVDGVDENTRRAVREQSQAANIKRVIDDNADKLVFIYGTHIRKTPGNGSNTMMAYRLQQLTGIEPISIDQTGGTPSSARRYQTPLYRGVERCGKLDYPVALRKRDGTYLARDGYDITIFFPHTNYSIGGRPDWLISIGGRAFLSLRLQPAAQQTLVRIFVRDEADDAVAIDHVLAPPESDRVTVALPKGHYRAVREWPDGTQNDLGELTID